MTYKFSLNPGSIMAHSMPVCCQQWAWDENIETWPLNQLDAKAVGGGQKKELLKLAYQTETGLEKLDQHGRSVGEKSSVIINASRKFLDSTRQTPQLSVRNIW